MTVESIIVLAVFLIAMTPFMLVGAYREGKRRRNTRDKEK